MRFGFWAVVAVVGGALVACGGPELDGDVLDGEVESVGEVELEARQAISARKLEWEIPAAKGRTQTRRLFKTARAFDSYFGRGSARAAGIDFAREWAAFYSAGARRSGGFVATFARLEVNETGRTLYLTTRLESPGPDCMVTMALTKPTALVAFRRPPTNPRGTRYLRDDTTRSCRLTCADLGCAADELCDDAAEEPRCEPTLSCRNTRCAPGFHCTMSAIACIRAPCPAALPQCIEDDTTCDRIVCADGFYCSTERDGLAECVERTVSCSQVRCRAGTYCTEAYGNAECAAVVTCASVRCGWGTRCYDVPVTGCAEAQCPPTRPECR